MTGNPGSFAIKAPIADLHARAYAFEVHKTMYAGKTIAAGDRIFLFASEAGGGRGLFARGIVSASQALARKPDPARQTPRMSIKVEQIETAGRPLGRTELRGFRDWSDEAPETELNFKLYRQATDKIVGLTARTADFLDGFFRSA